MYFKEQNRSWMIHKMRHKNFRMKILIIGSNYWYLLIYFEGYL